MTSETRGVPDSLEFQPGEGGFGNQVYECIGCGDRITGTENAVKHTSCRVPGTCPACDSPRGRVDLGVDYSRVDVCQECGTPYWEHFDGGVV
ncbi:hypothetical protein [Halobacterium sp. KA-6]|uniref:hypothetical protein n=1 Tax=Halobacterium sp. KA-6 TaxID=2896368 RepID=UPI001E303E2D|nr:hypothetical protein [Halobacterium sp. KA-6]MCD2204427.1 hypothetical protein [Halobacterium sp. KA-6]